jgi:hypothetical protein
MAETGTKVILTVNGVEQKPSTLSGTMLDALVDDGALKEAKLQAPSTDDVLLAHRVARIEIPYTDIETTASSPYQIGPTFPINTVIKQAYYEVDTTFTSGGGDAATISLGFLTDDVAGIVAATAISAGGNVFDAGGHNCIQDGDFANRSEILTAARKINCVRAGGQDLTAGSMVLFVEYVIAVP